MKIYLLNVFIVIATQYVMTPILYFYFNKKIFRVIFYNFIDKYENTLMSYELLISVL